jgi:carbonic anhydrase
MDDKLMPHDWTIERGNAVVNGEQPFTSVLCCSDPRVPPEVVFDQGLNDLFIIRGAGHTVTDQVLGSLEYSVTSLKPPVRLIVVLGHQDCGAIKAAIKEVFNNVTPPGNLASLAKAIRPAVELVRELPEDRRLPEATKNNVLLVVRQLKEDKYFGPLLKEKKVHVVGGIYQMETPIESGRVNSSRPHHDRVLARAERWPCEEHMADGLWHMVSRRNRGVTTVRRQRRTVRPPA